MAENYQKLSKVKQVELLESTVLTGTPQDVAEVYEKLGPVELSARALGIACRFRGLEWVKALIEGGAQFEFHLDGAAETKYDTSNKTVYETMLLDHIPVFYGSAPFNYISADKGYRHTDKKIDDTVFVEIDDTVFIFKDKTYPLLSTKERLAILEWILAYCTDIKKNAESLLDPENGEKLKAFLKKHGSPEEYLDYFRTRELKLSVLESEISSIFDEKKLLFYSLLEDNDAFTDFLVRKGVKIPEEYLTTIAEGKNKQSGWGWNDWVDYHRRQDVQKTICEFRKITKCLDGKKLWITSGFFSDTSTRDGYYLQKYDNHCLNDTFARFAFEECECAKVNKKELAEYAIEKDNVAFIAALAEAGAFKSPSVRESIIEKASNGNHLEILAYLLDFKNKKVDLNQEEKKREQKELRELAQSPTSVSYLKKIWSFEEQKDGTICLTKYKGEGDGTTSKVVVPEKIGQKTVTTLAGTFCRIPSYERYSNEKAINSIKEIVLPDTITTIDHGSFLRCVNLEACNAPKGLVKIGAQAFEACSHLKAFDIPETVISIGYNAFFNCESLTEMHIPDGIEKIERDTFRWCSSLKSFTIPQSVKSIGSGAFAACKSLTEIHIPDGIERIESETFSGCSSLKTIDLPESVTSIEYMAFERCEMLTEVKLPSGLKIIDWSAFQNCTALREIVIPDSVKAIGMRAFSGCTSLENLQIGTNVQRVAEDAFDGVPGYKKQEVTEGGVRYLGTQAIGHEKDLPEVIRFKEGTTEIAPAAFISCKGLREIILPESIRQIGDRAFEGCTNLITVVDSRKDIVIGPRSFDRTPIGAHFQYGGALDNPDDPKALEEQTDKAVEARQWLRTSGTAWDPIDQIEHFIADHYELVLLAIISDYRRLSFEPYSTTEDEASFTRFCTVVDEMITTGKFGSFLNFERIKMLVSHSQKFTAILQEYLKKWCPDQVHETDPSRGSFAKAGVMSTAEAKKVFKVSKYEDGRCGISGYKSKDSVVFIPAYIGTDKVISINEKAFFKCQYVNCIYIPDTIESIGLHAFRECPSLFCLFIPDSVSRINSRALSGGSYTRLFVKSESVAEKTAQDENRAYYLVQEYPGMHYEEQ